MFCSKDAGTLFVAMAVAYKHVAFKTYGTLGAHGDAYLRDDVRNYSIRSAGDHVDRCACGSGVRT